jgi:hypothetical protein
MTALALRDVTPEELTKFLNSRDSQFEFELGQFRLIHNTKRVVCRALTAYETKELVRFSPSEVPKESVEVFLKWYERRLPQNAVKWSK